ncbi:LEA type 2 family protein [Oscillatoria amoena NRMC-F 0135]|nr:LEA type 2 family protein [Oscillatoria amoena NRMC-F 0135]
MSILTAMIQESRFIIHRSKLRCLHVGVLFASLLFIAGCAPKEKVELRRIKDIVVDATNEPLLKANALLYNPNKIKMTLRKIDMEVYVDGKKAALIDQKLKTKIPAGAEFIVPLEVKLNLKELGFFDTMLAVLGGKKMKIRYTGSIRLTYKGVPVTIPVDYQDEVRVRI